MSEQEKNAGKPTEAPSTPSVELPKQQPESQVIILPPEAVRQAAASGSALQVVISSTHHSGPLPAPATLRAYREIIPGLPETIIDEFKKESAHRRRVQTAGQVSAVGIAAMSILCGVWLGYELKSALAAFAIVGPICGVVGIAQFLEFWLKAK